LPDQVKSKNEDSTIKNKNIDKVKYNNQQKKLMKEVNKKSSVMKEITFRNRYSEKQNLHVNNSDSLNAQVNSIKKNLFGNNIKDDKTFEQTDFSQKDSTITNLKPEEQRLSNRNTSIKINKYSNLDQLIMYSSINSTKDFKFSEPTVKSENNNRNTCNKGSDNLLIKFLLKHDTFINYYKSRNLLGLVHAYKSFYKDFIEENQNPTNIPTLLTKINNLQEDQELQFFFEKFEKELNDNLGNNSNYFQISYIMIKLKNFFAHNNELNNISKNGAIYASNKFHIKSNSLQFNTKLKNRSQFKDSVMNTKNSRYNYNFVAPVNDLNLNQAKKKKNI